MKTKIAISVLFFLLIGKFSFADSFRIEFDLNSCKLTSESKKILDENVNLIKQKTQNGRCTLVISTKSCKKELKKNRSIGLMRSRAIMDYLEEKYSIERSVFFIIDEHFNGLEDENCTNTRFVNFRFICE